MKAKIKIEPVVVKAEDGNIRSIETRYDIDLDISPDDIRILDESAQEEYSWFISRKLRSLV